MAEKLEGHHLADQLTVPAGKLNLGTTAVTATAAELNLLDDLPTDNSTVVAGAEDTNVVNVVITLKNAADAAISSSKIVHAYLSDASTGVGVAATAPDGGVAVGASGSVLAEVVADKVFILESTAAGLITLDVTESGTDTFYLVLLLPNGEKVVSNAITTAA